MRKLFIGTIWVGLMLGVLNCKPAHDSTSETSAWPATPPDGMQMCLVSKLASTDSSKFGIACWMAEIPGYGFPTPVCISMSTAAVSVKKIGYTAYDCLNSCGLIGGACEEAMAKKLIKKVALFHAGCTKDGVWAVEGDGCSAGRNRTWNKNDPESKNCNGTPTGWWALSDSERNRNTDLSSCGF